MGEQINSNRLTITLVALCLNEFGIVFLINMDYIKMSYFEKNKAKQGIFGIVNDPYPSLMSLSVSVFIQLWILTYGAFRYQPKECVEWQFDCGLSIVYLLAAFVVVSICIVYGLKYFKTQKID